MFKLIKFSILTVAIFFVLTSVVFAQEPTNTQATTTEVSEELNLDENVTPEDLEVSEPKILPDSPFYFFKNWGRQIRTFFAFRPIDKAKLRLRYASEKLLEAKKLAEKTKNPDILKKAAENYEKEIERIKNIADKIKEKASKDPRVSKFLDKFIKQQILHEKILEKLEEKVPPQVLEKIKETRERHLKRFGEVMQKLEEKPKIGERLSKILQEMKGSKFKEVKALQILKELEQRVPEDAREGIKKAQENVMRRLKEKLEKTTTSTQERLKRYIERIRGNPERKMEILEDIKSALKNRPEIRERLENAREKILEKIREREKKIGCPEIQRPAPGFCLKGRIVPQRDEKGCIVDFRCIVPGEIEIPERPEREEMPSATSTQVTPSKPKPVCVSLWDPVCGKNGKTYSNACWAKVAGVEIAHKGVCQQPLKRMEEGIERRIEKFEQKVKGLGR
jgi:hypothetical protein